MDVAALSIAMNQMQVKQQAQLSVMKMTMDASAVQSADMLKLLEAAPAVEAPVAVDPNLGNLIDVQV